ncbi:MAG: hypothetical protein V3S29_01490, partial [bacterium]
KRNNFSFWRNFPLGFPSQRVLGKRPDTRWGWEQQNPDFRFFGTRPENSGVFSAGRGRVDPRNFLFFSKKARCASPRGACGIVATFNR